VYGSGSSVVSILQIRRRADRQAFKVLGFLPAPFEQHAVPGHFANWLEQKNSTKLSSQWMTDAASSR
jgi:hypothetical protein